MANYSFDTRSRRYRNKQTGRFVSVAELREVSNNQIVISRNRTIALTDKLLEDNLSLRDWEKAVAREIKTIYLQIYRLAKPDTNFRDYGILGNLIKNQYGRLREFSLEIAMGSLSDSQIRDRVSRYISKAREAFEEGYRKSLETVNQWEKRVRTKKESCNPCVAFEAMGWQPIGTLPRPTERCDCFDRCGCVLVYSNSRFRPQANSVSAFGWLA